MISRHGICWKEPEKSDSKEPNKGWAKSPNVELVPNYEQCAPAFQTKRKGSAKVMKQDRQFLRRSWGSQKEICVIASVHFTTFCHNSFQEMTMSLYLLVRSWTKTVCLRVRTQVAAVCLSWERTKARTVRGSCGWGCDALVNEWWTGHAIPAFSTMAPTCVSRSTKQENGQNTLSMENWNKELSDSTTNFQ